MVVDNLSNLQKKWARMSWILGWEGADTRTSGTFFKAVVQAILLFGSETRVVITCIFCTLGGFQNWIGLQLKGIQPRCKPNISWVYPPLGETMEAEGMGTAKDYITWRHNMTVHYITTWKILKIYMGTKRMVVLMESMHWW